MDFEHNVLEYINKKLKSTFLDKVLFIATKMGDFGFIWIFTAVLLLIFEYTRKLGVVFSGAFVLATILGNLILKPFFARKRPCDDSSVKPIIKRPMGYSFPSGHTLTSFTAATVIASANVVAGVFAFILAGMIGFSRMYFYVHYPSDVIGGAVIGIAVGCISIRIGGFLLW